ncbi:MAG: response regulator [Cyanobacteria bacterium P01_F01_bin.116]
MAQILLIDSDRTNCQLLEQALALYDHDILVTQRTNEGLNLAATAPPDVILLDIDADGINSWQTIKTLKESSSTWLIPVIAMADSTVKGPLLIQAGFDTYERKPVSAKFILKKIDVLLDKVSTLKTGAIGHPPSVLGPPEPAQTSTSQATVVYVDDNPAASEAMAEIIQGAGYSYANITDSLRALPQLVDYNPKLIFLELVLPIANGYELCAQLRRISIFRNTPIIIVTNNDRMADRIRAKIVGASGFLIKPIRAQPVLKVLIKHLLPNTTVDF